VVVRNEHFKNMVKKLHVTQSTVISICFHG